MIYKLRINEQYRISIVFDVAVTGFQDLSELANTKPCAKGSELSENVTLIIKPAHSAVIHRMARQRFI